MNAKLQAIAEQAANNLRDLITEGADAITQAWDACIAEAQAQEEKPKLKLGFSITLDLDKNTADYDLTFGVRHRLTVSGEIPNPDQTTLPLDTEATVTLTTDSGSVTAPLPVLRDAVKELKRQKRNRM